MSSFNLVSDLKGLNGAIRGKLGSLGGVRSPEMLAMDRELRKQIRKTLSVPGGGIPSAPGQAPRKQTGALARSVSSGVVGAERRVAATWFTAPLLEEGVSAVAGATKTRKSGKRKGQSAGRKQRTVTIAARPFLERSIDAAKDAMGEAFVATARVQLGAD